MNRYPPFSITGSTYASLPFFVESMNVDTSGTSTVANAGFGLFTVRAIVEAHGGRIEASNRPEGGAKFTVDLPAI